MPQPKDVPEVLQGLTRAVIVALRPVELQCGSVVRKQRQDTHFLDMKTVMEKAKKGMELDDNATWSSSGTD